MEPPRPAWVAGRHTGATCAYPRHLWHCFRHGRCLSHVILNEVPSRGGSFTQDQALGAGLWPPISLAMTPPASTRCPDPPWQCVIRPDAPNGAGRRRSP